MPTYVTIVTLAKLVCKSLDTYLNTSNTIYCLNINLELPIMQMPYHDNPTTK